jgi:hypothetical protein
MKPGMKPVVWARSEPGTARFYTGPGRPDTNKRVELGQETRHGGLARHGPFTSKPVFYTKTCLPARIARFSARFFRAKRAGLGQKIEPACLDGPARFFNRAWRAGPKTGRASPGWAAHLDISTCMNYLDYHKMFYCIHGILPDFDTLLRVRINLSMHGFSLELKLARGVLLDKKSLRGKVSKIKAIYIYS